MKPLFKDDYALDKLTKIHVKGEAFDLFVTPRFIDHYMLKDYEPLTSRVIRTMARDIHTFVDVGAHYGYFTILVGRENPDCKIIAFEPVSENYIVLRKNVELNGLPNVNLVQQAVSNEIGLAQFEISEASDNSGFIANPAADLLRMVKVEVTLLDQFIDDIPNQPCLIKIDTEGNESRVLEGMRNLVQKVDDLRLVIEFNLRCLKRYHHEPLALLKQIDDLGFAIYFLHDDEGTIEAFDEPANWEMLMKGKNYKNLCCLKKRAVEKKGLEAYLPILPLNQNVLSLKAHQGSRPFMVPTDSNRRSFQRILLVNHNIYPFEASGTPLSTLNHALGLSRKGFEVAVLVPSSEMKAGYHKIKREGFTLYQIPALNKYDAFFDYAGENCPPEFWNSLDEVIKDCSPDLVHINDYLYMPAKILEVFSAKGCRVVRNVCNVEELCFRDYPVISSDFECQLCPGPIHPETCAFCFLDFRRISDPERSTQPMAQAIRKRVELRFEYVSWLYQNIVEKVIFTSEAFKTYFTRFVPIPEEKIVLIPRGFEFEFQESEKIRSRKDGKVHFSFIGNLMFSKGIDLVLRAFEVLSQRDDFVLHLHGKIVDHQYTPYIEKFKDLYPEKFRYHGPFCKETLPEIYRNIDVCLIPSYFDTYNRVLREALYFGTPVIVTDFFGAHIVKDGKNGFRIPVGDVNALVQRMFEILQDPKKLQDLTHEAAKTPIPTLKEEIDALVEHYKDIAMHPPQKQSVVVRVPFPTSSKPLNKVVRPIAIYLPQFHPIPENDRWWGKGFTEWTNVTKAKPLFNGHYQPHLPADLGFYDLRLPEVRKAQADLARAYGIFGFCYYHYWFKGRRLLERPFDEVLKSGEPDFPFCLCWANENWTRVWDGQEREVLLKQEYSEEDDLHHIRWLVEVFKDKRYIRVNGKPLILIYRVKNLPNASRTAAIWREEAKRLGMGEIYLCRFEIFPEDRQDASKIGFDASVEFQPDWINLGKPLLSPAYKDHMVYRYEDIVQRMLQKDKVPYKRYPCVTPSWDNSPRRKSVAVIFKDSTPDLYEQWLRKTIEGFQPFSPEENLIFLNAWNEWAEGNHLEPDQKFGRGYLEGTRRAIWASGCNHDSIAGHSIYEDCLQLIRLGREEDALTGLKMLLEKFPHHALYHHDLGILYFKKGCFEEARDHLEKAVKLDPENPAFRKTIESFPLWEREGGFKTDEHGPHSSDKIKPQMIDKPERGENKKVSIILPTFNDIYGIQNTLTSILENTTTENYEVIVVDGGSTDGTAEYLKNLKAVQIRAIFQKQNKGMNEACHTGAELASGKYLLFLKSGVEVQKGWLELLLQFVESTHDCGAAGPKIIAPNGRLEGAGGILFSDGTFWFYGKGMDPSDPQYNFVRETDFCPSTGLIVRSFLWHEVGGFDPRYTFGGYEAVDFCLEIQKRGFKVYYFPHSTILYQEEWVPKDRHPIMHKMGQVMNRTQLVSKWGEEFLKPYPQNHITIFKPATRTSTLKILVIAPILPFPGLPAESNRLVHLLQILRQMNCHITFFVSSGVMENRYRPFLERIGIEVYTWDPDAMTAVGYQMDDVEAVDYFLFFQKRHFDYVIINFWYLAEYYLPLIRRYSPETKIIIDTVFIHYLREIQEAEVQKNLKAGREALVRKDQELTIYSKAERIWVATETDRKEIENYVAKVPIDIIPHIYEKVDFIKRFEETSDLLFIGHFHHQPYRDAIQYFCQEVFPRITEELPDVKLYVVGNDFPDEVKALASDQIVVSDAIENLTPFFKKTRIFINPLRYETGMKGKIGEVLSWGLPMVTTSIGIGDTPLVDGRDVLIADTVEAFKTQVVRLYRDPELWNKLSANGKQTVEVHWSPQVIRTRLEKVFCSLISPQPMVSIIVLAHNQLEFTKKCLDSILRYTDVPFELIFVDNGSTDGTKDYMEQVREGKAEVGGHRLKISGDGIVLPEQGGKKKKKGKKGTTQLLHTCKRFKVIQNEKNFGFAAGNNRGLTEARGNYVLLMNNDVVVTPGWLRRMLQVAEKRSEIGIVGPMSNYVSGPQWVETIGYDPRSLSSLNSFAQEFSKKHQGQSKPFWRVVGFCMLIKRAVIDRIGGLDERFGLGNFEDDDFSIRARLAGFESWIAGDCFVHHFGSKTFEGTGVDYRESLRKNWEIFKRKWGIPQEVSYGSPVDLADILDQPFSSLKHYYPLQPEELTISFGERLFEAGDGEGAKTIFHRILQKDPKNADLLNNLGVIAFQEREFEQAIAYFEKGLAEKPYHPELLENLGQCFLARLDYAKARDYFEKALLVKPDSIIILNHLGNCLIQTGDLLRAEEIYTRSYQIDPSQREVREILSGLKHLKIGESERRVNL